MSDQSTISPWWLLFIFVQYICNKVSTHENSWVCKTKVHVGHWSQRVKTITAEEADRVNMTSLLWGFKLFLSSIKQFAIYKPCAIRIPSGGQKSLILTRLIKSHRKTRHHHRYVVKENKAVSLVAAGVKTMTEMSGYTRGFWNLKKFTKEGQRRQQQLMTQRWIYCTSGSTFLMVEGFCND